MSNTYVKDENYTKTKLFLYLTLQILRLYSIFFLTRDIQHYIYILSISCAVLCVSLLSFLFYSLISFGEWFFDVSFTFKYQAVNIGLITESNLCSRFIRSWQSISIAEKRHQCLRYIYIFFYRESCFIRDILFVFIISLYYYSLNVNIFKSNIFKLTAKFYLA